jgi:replication initiator protein
MTDEAGKYKLTKIQQRQRDASLSILEDRGTIEDAIFQHSVLCQTFLPYRNPGDIDIWQQKQGNVSLAIQATKALNPETQEFEFIGLPFGTKSRLILAHINSQAIKLQTSEIDVENSMTAFIRRMGLNTDGRTLDEVKNQLRRLASSLISLGYTHNSTNGVQVDLKIVKAFDVWFPKDDRQRILWNSHIQLTEDYFKSLLDHAIPMDERALGALSHNAMALDIYAWLTQRLHRVAPGKPQFVSWKDVKEQFGRGYDNMFKFKQIFRRTIEMVRAQYLMARIEEEKNRGFWLHCSPSPIEKKTIVFLGSDNK